MIVLAIWVLLTLSCRRGGSATYEFVSPTASFLFSARQGVQWNWVRTQSLEIDWRSRCFLLFSVLCKFWKVRAVPQLHVPIRQNGRFKTSKIVSCEKILQSHFAMVLHSNWCVSVRPRIFWWKQLFFCRILVDDSWFSKLHTNQFVTTQLHYSIQIEKQKHSILVTTPLVQEEQQETQLQPLQLAELPNSIPEASTQVPEFTKQQVLTVCTTAK